MEILGNKMFPKYLKSEYFYLKKKIQSAKNCTSRWLSIVLRVWEENLRPDIFRVGKRAAHWSFAFVFPSPLLVGGGLRVPRGALGTGRGQSGRRIPRFLDAYIEIREFGKWSDVLCEKLKKGRLSTGWFDHHVIRSKRKK